jgi:hypothetical protein
MRTPFKNLVVIALAALSVSGTLFAGQNGPSRVHYIRDGQHTANFNAELFRHISGEYENEVQSDLAWYTNSIEITPDEVIKARVAAQVGRPSDDRFPYPTVCMLYYRGKIDNFLMIETVDGSNEPSFYHIAMASPKLTLIASPKNSPKCEEYVRINNNEKPLTWYWVEFSLKYGDLVERGGTNIYDRIGPSAPDLDADPEKN